MNGKILNFDQINLGTYISPFGRKIVSQRRLGREPASVDQPPKHATDHPSADRGIRVAVVAALFLHGPRDPICARNVNG